MIVAAGKGCVAYVMDKFEMATRTKQFAHRVMRLAEALPRSRSGTTIANQIIRSGTSVAANYRAALRGRSKAEFISKIGTVLEEADETLFWLELIEEAGLRPTEQIAELNVEADALVRIFNKTRSTAKS